MLCSIKEYHSEFTQYIRLMLALHYYANYAGVFNGGLICNIYNYVIRYNIVIYVLKASIRDEGCYF